MRSPLPDTYTLRLIETYVDSLHRQADILSDTSAEAAEYLDRAAENVTAAVEALRRLASG